MPNRAFEGEVGAETEPRAPATAPAPAMAPVTAPGMSARRMLSCTNRGSLNPRIPALPKDLRCVSLSSTGGGCGGDGGAGDDEDDGEDEEAAGECCRRSRYSSGLRLGCSADLLADFFVFAAVAAAAVFASGTLVGVVGVVVDFFDFVCCCSCFSVVAFVSFRLIGVERSAARSGLIEV